MRIKRLEVIGFKSFCDRTVIHFNEPITGVVGPNGCGKSNIVDAIRWCMGEQSAKHLRGKAMDDVIFSGSESRGPLGMCEVTLVFENDGQVPIEYLAYSEIAVTRKLYRDGTSEYFLNKTPCRLRDVTDFFLGTGVGAKAYSIIEQGRVGMIVSSKPEDRRFLIEEAAGITKYKVKKKAAEKKMEATRQNLLRVTDVVAEIEKQLASLRRQAQKAERYRQYKVELRDLDLWTASQKWLGFTVETQFVAHERTGVAAAAEAVEGLLVARETDVEAARLAAVADEQRLSEMQTELFAEDNRIRLGESQCEHEARQATVLDQRAADAETELQLIATRAGEDAQSRIGAEEQLAAAQIVVAGQASELATREERLREARTLQGNVQRAVDEGRAGLAQCKADIVGGEGNERAAARRRDEYALRAGRVGEENARLAARAGEIVADVAAIEERLSGLRQLKLELASERGRAETRVAELKTALAETQPKLDSVTGELHKRRSRRSSLVELHARYEGFAGGTRAVLAEKDTRWGIVGPLADVVEAPAELEPAVEALLAERLGAVVVETQEVGVDAIEQLKAKKAGRAAFLPLNRFVAAGERPSLPEGARGWLIDSLRADESHAALLHHLFGDVVLVDDLLSALDLWRAGAHHTFVTPTGEVLAADGVLIGGSPESASAGVLSQKREIRELDAIVADLEAEHAELSRICLADKAELTALQTTLETLQRDAHQRDVELLTHDKDAARLGDELERANTRLHALATERSELEHLHVEAARETEEAQLALRAARDRLLGLEDTLSRLAGDQVARLDEVEAAQEAVTELRVRHAQAEEQRRSLRATLDRLDADHQARLLRQEKLGRSLTEDRAEAEALRGTVAARREELTGLASQHARDAEALQLMRNAYEARRGELAETDAAIRVMRAELDGHHKTLGQLELRLHDLASSRAHLEETIVERYRIAIADAAHDHHLRPLAGDAEEQRARELRELIERMGEINLNAIEEFNALETRYTFLVGQKADLEQALAQLEEAIDRINKTSKKRFREVFDMVNAKFQEIFPRCFRGGQARLVLTDEENLLESGIEIIAQPPGKKNATVELLSGGEKAMTAVALIFSIFLIKPSPFCLLDEVDAPLDEANVGRFNDLIRELTDRSQFIVITHNKRTMQIVDTLYGVTMEEPGISKLVSVNLGQIGRDGNFTQRSATRAA